MSRFGGAVAVEWGKYVRLTGFGVTHCDASVDVCTLQYKACVIAAIECQGVARQGLCSLC